MEGSPPLMDDNRNRVIIKGFLNLPLKLTDPQQSYIRGKGTYIALWLVKSKHSNISNLVSSKYNLNILLFVSKKQKVPGHR